MWKLLLGKNEKKEPHASVKGKSKDSVLQQVFRTLDKFNIYEEILGTTRSWLGFHTDSCKILAQGSFESSSDIFFYPHKQAQPNNSTLNLGSRSCDLRRRSHNGAENTPKIGTSSFLCVGEHHPELFDYIIAAGQWHSLPPLPLWLHCPVAPAWEMQSSTYSQDWAWGPVELERNCHEAFPLGKPGAGNLCRRLGRERHNPYACRNLVGKQRGAKISAYHHAGCSQAPPAIGPAALMGQSYFTGPFPREIGCHRKWLRSSLPSESVLELSGTSQRDLPQKMLNHLWSISNHVPFPAWSSGWAPGAVIFYT